MSASSKKDWRLVAIFEAGLARPGRGAFAAEAHDTHAERAAHARHDAADLAEGVDAERFAVQADAHGLLPFTFLEALHLVGNVAEVGEDDGPRELGCRIRAPGAGGAHDDAFLGAAREVNVGEVAAGLADHLQLRQTVDHRGGKG